MIGENGGEQPMEPRSWIVVHATPIGVPAHVKAEVMSEPLLPRQPVATQGGAADGD